jgi:tetratricopeptide (TPR) repeat protein
VRASFPRGADLRRRAPASLAVIALTVITVLAVAQPWRAEQKGDDALRLAGTGNYAAALKSAERARELNPLSVQPYFEEAAVEDAAGNPQAALNKLQRAVQLQPASPEAWRRLGDYYLDPLSDPSRALPVLRAALYLDPESADGRAAFVSALRASRLVIDQSPRPAREKSPRGSSAIR